MVKGRRSRFTRTAVRSVFVALLLAGASCRSVRLLADPQRGFEAAGERTLALGFDRLAVEPRDAEPDHPALRVDGVADGRAAIVLVPLWAFNGSDQPWSISLEHFDLNSIADPDDGLPPQRRATTTDTPLAVVAPGGRASLSLPLRLPATVIDEPHGRFRLRAMTVEDGHAVTIFSRDLVLDELRPLRQTLYVVGTGAVVLAVAVML